MVPLVYLAGTGWLAGAIDTDTDTGGTASVLGRGVGGRRVLVAAGVRAAGSLVSSRQHYDDYDS